MNIKVIHRGEIIRKNTWPEGGTYIKDAIGINQQYQNSYSKEV